MFCKHCGKEVSEESAFCSGCGGSINETIHQNTNNSSQKPIEWLCCPKCRSKKLQAVIESTTTGTGGGYSAGRGCLGGILLGPLGLLCGSGGKKTTINTTHETKWLCHDCGNRFTNPEEEMSSYKVGVIFFVVASALLLILALWISINYNVRGADRTLINFMIIAGVIGAGSALICLLAYKKAKATYETMKNENQRNS